MSPRSLALSVAALVATSPLACKNKKESPEIPVVDDEAQTAPPPVAVAAPDEAPASDGPRIHVRASARELDDVFAWVKVVSAAWADAPFDVPAQVQAMLLQLGYGPTMWTSLDWQGVMAVDVLFPLSDDAAPGDLRAYGTLATANARAVLDAVPESRRPQPLGNGMWEMVEETMRVLFREQPRALEFALVAGDLDQAPGLVVGAGSGRRIQVVADQIPEGWLRASEFLDIPGESPRGRQIDAVSGELSELRFEVEAGTQRDLTLELAARGPFARLGLDPVGQPRKALLPVENWLPGAPVAAVEVSWGSPMLLHKMLDRSLPLDQIPAPFDKMARDAVGSAHALLDEVKGDAVIGLYLSKSGKVALVLAAEVANPGAAKGQLRTLTGSLAAALEGYRELAGGAKDAAFKVTLAQDGGRLGSDKVDLLAVSVPKNMEQEAAKAAYALSKKKELEILAGVRDQVAILAIGGGAAEVFADKKAGTLTGDGGLTLARGVSGGCNICVGVDPVGLGRLAATVARDGADDPAQAKEIGKLLSELNRLGEIGDLGLGIHVAADRGAIALVASRALLVPPAATSKKIREILERLWEPYFEGEPEEPRAVRAR
ncbi:MAG: hypothetical protein H6711_29040 [Myxococcales bacterium]|nr:hypothetical protein [Myxococcales bacterium]